MKRRRFLGLTAGALIGGGLAYQYAARSGWSLRNTVSALVSESDIEIEPGLAYGSHPRHRLDVYRPPKPGQGGPVALFLYGGGWKSGDRDTYRFVGSAFAANGITAVIPDYRLYPDVTFPGFVQDAAHAYRWTSQNVATAGRVQRPIILVGHSAGAHIGALLAYDRRYLEAAAPKARTPAGFVGLAGPYAFDPTTWPTTRAIFATASEADEARPVSFAHRDAPPTLVMHGEDDNTVKPWNTRTLAGALREAGAPVTKREFAGIGHIGLVVAIARPFRWRAPILDETLSFIRQIDG